MVLFFYYQEKNVWEKYVLYWYFAINFIHVEDVTDSENA